MCFEIDFFRVIILEERGNIGYICYRFLLNVNIFKKNDIVYEYELGI